MMLLATLASCRVEYPYDSKINQNSSTVTDIDGNVYHSVTIGKQTWMVENLKTTKFNDGTPIPLVTDTTWKNLTTPGYCWNNNDAANKDIYGALYNFYAASLSFELAPVGWHVATDDEWTTLGNFLIVNGYNYDGSTSGNNYAKALAANTNWLPATNIGAIGHDLSKNNITGFSALPGGYRDDGFFNDAGYIGLWWSSTYYEGNGLFVGMRYDGSGIFRDNDEMNMGYSVRCVKNK